MSRVNIRTKFDGQVILLSDIAICALSVLLGRQTGKRASKFPWLQGGSAVFKV